MVPDPIPLEQVRRVLVVKLRHHGDVLLTSPVFSLLKKRAPHLEIDALVYADTAEMLSLHPAIRTVHTIDRRWKKQGIVKQARAEWQLLSTLRAEKYDLLIHLTEHWRGAWLSRLCGVRWSVAAAIGNRGKRWKKAFTHRYSQARNAGRPVVESNLDALRRIGLYPDSTERQLSLVPGPEAEAQVETLLAEAKLAGQPFIHIHPASRWFFKCWPVEPMIALIRRLQADGHRIVLSAAPDTTELKMLETIQAGLTTPATLFPGNLSLKALAALTARAQLFIGMDSAPMHIAAAVGTPVVVLFGPSGEKQWGPWGVPARVITSPQYTCRPCGVDGCGGGKISDCLTSISPDTVYAAACELLRQPPR